MLRTSGSVALEDGSVEQVDVAMRFLGSGGFSRAIGSFACYQRSFYKQIRYIQTPTPAMLSFLLAVPRMTPVWNRWARRCPDTIPEVPQPPTWHQATTSIISS